VIYFCCGCGAVERMKTNRDAIEAGWKPAADKQVRIQGEDPAGWLCPKCKDARAALARGSARELLAEVRHEKAEN
jgi:hypothetical protein